MASDIVSKSSGGIDLFLDFVNPQIKKNIHFLIYGCLTLIAMES